MPAVAAADTASQAQESDLLLLRQFTDTGDPQIFAEIVRRYAGVVYSASHRILNDEARAQDVSQETFFRLMRQPKLVTHSLGGWLHRSATHLAIDAKRSESSRRQREKTYWVNKENEARSNREPKWEEISPYVDQALIELPEPTRTLLVRHFLQGTPQATLAGEMNTSAATISRKIKAGVEELQKILKKKGIYVALLALTDFCVRETARAAPARLLSELGKMQMVGSVSVVPPTPPVNPPVLWPTALKVPAAAAGDSALKIVASCVGGAGLLAVAAVVIMAWANHAGPSAPPPAPPSPTETHQDIPVSQPRTVTLPGDSLSSTHITAFERTGGIGDKVTVTFGDTSTRTLAWSEASTMIQQQTRKTIEQLEKESAGK
jgi:RNA polymerase sigma factor (sigma-70 family)